MAVTRGRNREEMIALDMATVTADASLVESPCFVYSIVASLIDTNATGGVSIADSTASGDADKETTKIEIKLGSGGVSAAGGAPFVWQPPKPLHIRNTLVADISNVTVSVAYLPVG